MATETITAVEADRQSIAMIDMIDNDEQTAVTATELAAAPEPDVCDYPTRFRFYSIIASIGLVVLLGGLDANIIATAVPAITNQFHSVSDIGWYSAAYRLTACAFQFMFGKLYTLYPVKYVFMASLVVFLIGNLLAAAAADSIMFIFGRAVAGLGYSGGSAGCYTLLAQICPMRLRPIYMSMFGLIQVLASIISPILGGIFVEELSWRWCFWVTLPIGVLALIVIAIFLPYSATGTTSHGPWRQIFRHLNLTGNLLLFPALTFLFVVLSWAGLKYSWYFKWSDPRVIVFLILFAIFSAAFLYDQHRQQDKATLPPRIVKQRSIFAGIVFALCCNSALNMYEYYMPIYFQIIRDWSPARSGYMMLPVIVGAMLGFLVNGIGTSVWGHYAPFMIISSFLMAISSGLMTTWDLNTPLAKIIGYSGCIGFAGGLGFQSPQSAAQNTLPSEDASMGIAVVLFAQNFGPALFSAVAQTILDNKLIDTFEHSFPNISAYNVEKLGLSELKASVGSQNSTKASTAINEGLMQTWFLGIALACTTMIGSLLMEWRSVKEKTS